MGLRWTASAGKHGIAREDALHAITNAVFAESEFDEPRVPGHLRPTLFIGPPRQRGGPLLEVTVEIVTPEDVVMFHVMVARAKHLQRIGREDERTAWMSTDHQYDAAADWAETEMTLKPGSATALQGSAATALQGSAAADLGRGLLARATGGRPALDSAAKPGEHSRVRQVRLPADLGGSLDALARAQNRRVSDVMRDALTDYISTHRAG